ncbi:hypothetical protein AAF712_011078 [Marasmius tenuissimus]|uniref:GST N-terminal domain-containing protein n=1 Tax=Marasmius tenuissimus TaxID=585030 RepID=A0ABR2ZL25_9AGAR|nr:hypothetical protein PM082_024629 [Marasmius tenuissimus]
MAQKPIIVYDIASQVGTWSPNVWKTRYALSYYGIPYELVALEMPAIAAKCKEIGAEPTGKWADGTDQYTCPFIHDPNTGKAVSDSLKIAIYLETTYLKDPSKTLFPPGSVTLQQAFGAAFMGRLGNAVRFVLNRTAEVLNDGSRDYFIKARVDYTGGVPLEDVKPKGDDIPKVWKAVEADFGAVDSWFASKDDKFATGSEKPIWVDVAVGGVFIWVRQIYGVDSGEWKAASSWQNGRWGRLVKELEKYEKSV